MNNEAYLVHHGVKGMRWGVRRYQNKDGSLIKSRKRLSLSDRYKKKKELKKLRNEMINKAIDYDAEFDKTDRGQKLWKKYAKEIDRLMDDENWDDDPKNIKRFDAAEKNYLYEQGRYTAKKLLAEYGTSALAQYLGDNKSPQLERDVVDEMGKLYTRIHGM